MQALSFNSYSNATKQADYSTLNKSAFYALAKVPSSDVFEKKSPTEMNVFAKSALMAGVSLAICLLLNRADKVKISKLAKNIDFKKADTLEQAKEFLNKNFKIQCDDTFKDSDLDLLNWFNEGMCSASNKLKGVLRLPEKLTIQECEQDLAAAVSRNKRTMFLNRKHIAVIEDGLQKSVPNYYKGILEYLTINKQVFKFDTSNLDKFFDEFSKDSSELKTRMRLFYELNDFAKTKKILEKSPYLYLKNLLDRSLIAMDDLDGYTFEQLRSIEPNKQSDVVYQILQKAQKKYNTTFSYKINSKGDFQVVYHELGHVQDTIDRVLASGKYDSPDDYSKKLKKWLANEERMRVANLISEYASTGPGEFIAEVYADILCGKPIDKDVLKLYKQLWGPRVPKRLINII